VAFGSGCSGQTYTLTTATSAGSGNDTIIAPSPSTLTSADSVNVGAGSNTLVLQGAGSYSLPSTLRNIQTLSVPGVTGGTTSVNLRSTLDNLVIKIGQGEVGASQKDRALGRGARQQDRFERRERGGNARPVDCAMHGVARAGVGHLEIQQGGGRQTVARPPKARATA
jgi:hypothetical protein